MFVFRWRGSDQKAHGGCGVCMQVPTIMAVRTRIIHVKKHEQIVIRMDKHAWKAIIEFQDSQLTVFEQGGKLFTRTELKDGDDDETVDETDDESEEMNAETIPVTPTLPPRRRSSAEIAKNVTVRKRLSKLDRTDLEALQLELFGSFSAGDTQLDL